MKTWSDLGIDLPSHTRGPEVDTTCPKCSATRRKKNARCLSINLDEGVALCHHCGWNATLKQGEGRRYEPQMRSYAKPRVHRLTPLPEKVIAWFLARGIPERVLANQHIGWGEMYFGELEDLVWCIQFPYYRKGELVNVKYRTLDKHFRMATGAERILYGVDEIASHNTLIWVEGEIDRLSVEVAGFTACVSVPDGAPDAKSQQYESKFNFLQSAEEQLAQVETHILAVDNDANGQRLEYELSRRLGVEKCRRVTWPDGCKDANDVLVKHGTEALKLCIQGAESYPIEGLLTVRDFYREAWQVFENGLPRGMSTGWRDLDEHYTVAPGQLTIVTGIPAHGKTSLIQALAINLARLHDWKIALHSPEDRPVGRLVNMMAQRYAGLPIRHSPEPHMSPRDFADSLDWIGEHFYILQPEEHADSTLAAILDLSRMAVLRYGVKGLIIDPWGDLEHQRPRQYTESEYISQSLGTLRAFGRNHGVHIWLIVHPIKLAKGGDGKYPVPTLYDCSGSAAWRNKADNGLVIYRETTTDHNVQIHVSKVRFREVGRPGIVKLRYDPETGRFSE